jgi:hypothetical protein
MSGFTTRKIICKKCGYKGLIDAHDTKNLPRQVIFTFLGKDSEGYFHYQCPSCGTDESYSPFGFVNPMIKVGCFTIIAVIVWLIIKSCI